MISFRLSLKGKKNKSNQLTLYSYNVKISDVLYCHITIQQQYPSDHYGYLLKNLDKTPETSSDMLNFKSANKYTAIIHTLLRTMFMMG